MTGTGHKEDDSGFKTSDVTNIDRFKAHSDLINQVTFVPELQLIATCSFDCNVKMWRADTTFDNNDKKCGSLKLGTGASNNPNATEAEKMADAKVWKIKVDHLKIERQNLDREEAE